MGGSGDGEKGSLGTGRLEDLDLGAVWKPGQEEVREGQ